MSEQPVNGTAPATPQATADDGECVDCATTGEKILAGLAIGFGLLIIIMGIDMATGGKISGMVPAPAAPESE